MERELKPKRATILYYINAGIVWKETENESSPYWWLIIFLLKISGLLDVQCSLAFFYNLPNRGITSHLLHFSSILKMKNLDNDNRENMNEICRRIGKLRRNWEKNQKKILAMVPHVLMQLSSAAQFMWFKISGL